jgi:hypothetical protein
MEASEILGLLEQMGGQAVLENGTVFFRVPSGIAAEYLLDQSRRVHHDLESILGQETRRTARRL